MLGSLVAVIKELPIVTGLNIATNVGLVLTLAVMQVREENECHEDESRAGAVILRH